MSLPAGALVISLDLELNWGVFDTLRLEDYRENLLGVRRAVPGILELFRQHEIHATWAAVGMLCFSSREELLRALPAKRPAYLRPEISAYNHIESVGQDEATDPLHFGLSLVRQILAEPHQEFATHTFSHYYCLEPGQDVEAFAADLQAARSVAAQLGAECRSLVFPRNQFNAEYVAACRAAGLAAYRGNQRSWVYAPTAAAEQSLVRRGLRLLDAYLPLTGHHVYPHVHRVAEEQGICDIPASRFLRPYSPQLRALEPLRLRRIRSSMTYAARRGGLYHLWWHPHNFGAHTAENLAMLARILEHFVRLRKQYGMESLSMGEAAERTLGSPKTSPHTVQQTKPTNPVGAAV